MKIFLKLALLTMVVVVIIGWSTQTTDSHKIEDIRQLKNPVKSPAKPELKKGSNGDMLQVTSGEHELGFKPGEMYVAALSHM